MPSSTRIHTSPTPVGFENGIGDDPAAFRIASVILLASAVYRRCRVLKPSTMGRSTSTTPDTFDTSRPPSGSFEKSESNERDDAPPCDCVHAPDVGSFVYVFPSSDTVST